MATLRNCQTTPMDIDEENKPELDVATIKNRWSDAGSARSLTWIILNEMKNNPKTQLIADIWTSVIPSYLHFDKPSVGMIYVCGGRCSKVLQPQHYLNSVEMFDPIGNTWIQLPSMISKRVGAANIEVNGCLYVIGGYSEHPDKPLSSGEKFNPMTGEWLSITPMKMARFGHAISSVSDRYIYVIGGDCRRSLVREVEKYDTVTDTWELMGQIPNPVAGGRMLEGNGKLYLVGGDVGSHPLSFTNKIRVFDTEVKHLTETWNTLPVSLDVGRSACAVTWANDKKDSIVVIGGYATDSENFFELATGESINIETNERRAIPALNEPRAGCRAITLNNKIYVIGGESPVGAPADNQTNARTQATASRATLIEAMRRRLASMADLLIDNIFDANQNPNGNSNGNVQTNAQTLTQQNSQPLQLEPMLFNNPLNRTITNIAPADNSLNLQNIPNILNNISVPPPANATGRILHDEIDVFDIEKWQWVSNAKLPRMSQPRTAAAVCTGRGFPMSFGYDWNSKREWKPALSRKSSLVSQASFNTVDSNTLYASSG